jgi:hypothetical protein
MNGYDSSVVPQPDEGEVAGSDIQNVPNPGYKRAYGRVKTDMGVIALPPAILPRGTRDAESFSF